VPHMFVPEVAQKFRANASLGAGLKFVIHIKEKQDHKTTGQQDCNEKTRTALKALEVSRLCTRLRREGRRANRVRGEDYGPRTTDQR
jgi:hypothetical protein